jgi:hypothetical protein
MKLFSLLVFIFMSCLAAPAQKIIRETPTPSPTPFVPRPLTPKAPESPPSSVPAQSAVPVNSSANPASVGGNVYRNADYRFEIRFPNGWQIAGDETGEYLREQGYDLSLKAPEALDNVNKARINRALKNVTVLLTAFRASEGAKDGAVLRVSAEDLSAVPEIKDAVDYFDLMRSQFGSMKLPADFKFSETQAEKLGSKQFAFLDTSTSAGKKRLYATVRNRRAIMFTLSYRTDEDLRSMRQILATGDFNIK